MSTEEHLPPNYERLDKALRSVGYSFEAAVADIIDNSIDAIARHILVRLILRRDGHLDLAIWDNGKGMDEKTLREAMRFGADVSRDMARLGKFGLGLKLASLSQAKELRVITARNDALAGRGWLEHGISSGFASTIIDTVECRQIVENIIPDRTLLPSGTLVSWSRLYRVGQHHIDREEHAQKILRRLEQYLPLAFHRFLSGRPRKVQLSVDIWDEAAGRAGIPISLDGLDPFGYETSGHNSFPARMQAASPYHDRINITAHIWPPNSDSPGYKLPGGANARQGFYFYRNNRLIQGGGWNGLRETEPHSSLARLEMDISPDFDVEVSIDVRKVEIHLPPDLASSIQRARTAAGLDFKGYLALADKAYRKRQLMVAELPLIPSEGLPSPLKKFLHEELRVKATAKHRDLKFRWKKLEPDTFFEIDRDRGHLLLNSLYRRHLLHGLPGSSADLPVVKCLLFLVLEEAVLSERTGPRLRERLGRVNRILAEAVKYERTPE